jgi:hypothetical protein
MLLNDNCGLMDLEAFRAEIAAGPKERTVQLVHDRESGVWTRVDTDEPQSTPEPGQGCRVGQFVFDVTYQDRPDLDPRNALAQPAEPTPPRVYEDFTD